MAYEFLLPDIGEGLTEAEIVRWVVAVGEPIEADAPLVEVETDKAVVEITSPKAGIVLFRGAEAGTTINVGAVLAVIGDAGETWSPESRAAAPIVGTLVEEAEILPPQDVPAARPPAAVNALPLVRKLARDLGVDLHALTGTGPQGRITRDDVEAAAGRRPSPAGLVPSVGVPAGEDRVRLSKLRRTIADHMERSWREIPHVTTFEGVDGERLLDARRALAARYGTPFPLETLVISALLPVLAEFPEFNATLDGEDLILKRHYDIGVAVDTPDGLIVPVVRDAGRFAVRGLAAEIVRLSAAATARRLAPAELGGQTFTVSNIGAVGGGYGTPIIPYGTIAILSIGRADPTPAVRGGAIVAVRMLPLSLSYDHRVIDGAAGRRFMARLRENLEEPALFLAG